MNKFKTYINVFSFQFLFMVISFIVGIPLFNLFKLFIKKIYNIDYISLYTIKSLLHNIPFILILIVLIILLAFYLLFNMSCIICLLNNKKHFIKLSFKKAKDIFKPKYTLYIIYPIIYIIFMLLGIWIISYMYIDIFNILINVIFNKILLLIVSIVSLIIMFILLITGIKGLNEYVLHDESFKEYNKCINIFINIRRVLTMLFKKAIVFVVVYNSIIFLSYQFFAIKGFNNSIDEGIIISSIIVLLFIYVVFEIVSDFIILNMEYYDKKRVNFNFILFILNIIIIGLFGNHIINYMYKYNNGETKNSFIYDYNVTITAHRGASSYAPENTMAAFNKANDLNVPYVELDVHESKDGVLFVLHDNTLQRILGIPKYTYKVNYPEFKDLNVISRFDEYQEEKVPLFEDVLNWYKDKNFTLNIELKQTPFTTELPNKVVDLLHKYKLVDRVIVASFDVDAVLKVKELDNSIKIVYLGNEYTGDDRFDYYSINYAGITNEVVDDVHSKNKEIFAWTINDEKLLQSMLNYRVDNIITNDPIMAKEVINNYKDRSQINALFDFMLNIDKK